VTVITDAFDQLRRRAPPSILQEGGHAVPLGQSGKDPIRFTCRILCRRIWVLGIG
jgi:hypothetical protein